MVVELDEVGGEAAVVEVDDEVPADEVPDDEVPDDVVVDDVVDAADRVTGVLEPCGARAATLEISRAATATAAARVEREPTMRT